MKREPSITYILFALVMLLACPLVGAAMIVLYPDTDEELRQRQKFWAQVAPNLDDK